MAPELEKTKGEFRVVTKGPDKWNFIHDGVLDAKYDGTDHKFTADRREISVSIASARKLPAWQCPEWPDTDRGSLDHDRVWIEAWEFTGYGDGCHIIGVYSPITRKGILHCWPIALAGHRECERPLKDMALFFRESTNSDAILALTRAMRHMVRGSAVAGYHVDCEPCWKMFQHLRTSCTQLP